MRLFRLSLAIAGLLAPALLVGCPDPDEQYHSFIDRHEAIYGPFVPPSGKCEATCTPPEAGMADGNFLLTLSVSLAPNTPLIFDTEVTTGDGTMSMVLQPIDAKTRMQPTGEPINVGPCTVEGDGCFTCNLTAVTLVGATNPVTCNDVTADVVLIGSLCAYQGELDFFCGTVDGITTSMIELTGSTFTLERLETAGTYPEPPTIDCAGTEAVDISGACPCCP